jgi:GNAT superfamily N-acetyltransferase
MENEESDLGYWRWAHTKLNNGLGAVIRFAEDPSGKIVGHYAVVFTELTLDGRTVVGAQSFDVFVAPSHRRQGIFQQLCISTLKEATRKGTPLVYGFTQTEGAAWKGFTGGIGYIHVANVPRMIYVLEPRLAAKRRYGNRLRALLVSAGLRLLKRTRLDEPVWSKKVSSFDPKAMSAFWNDVKRTARIMVARTPRYLKWRYLDRPNREYALFTAEENGSMSGFMVVRIRRGENMRCTLVDFLSRNGQEADKDEVLKDLTLASLKYASDLGADVVDAWIPYQYAASFKALGFISRPTDMGRIAYSSTLEKSFYGNPANYYLTMGDSYGG